MLNALTRFIGRYQATLVARRAARRKLIQSQLDEVEALLPQVEGLLTDAEQEQAELQTFLSVTSEE